MLNSSSKKQASRELEVTPNALELVGVYKFTRRQAAANRRRD